MAHLIAKEIIKRYRKRTVVDAASLTVASGEVVGLLGPNGAGKTTCFYDGRVDSLRRGPGVTG